MPYGTGWLRIVRKAGFAEVHLSPSELYFEHHHTVVPPYLFIVIEGRPETYRMANIG